MITKTKLSSLLLQLSLALYPPFVFLLEKEGVVTLPDNTTIIIPAGSYIALCPDDDGYVFRITTDGTQEIQALNPCIGIFNDGFD